MAIGFKRCGGERMVMEMNDLDYAGVTQNYSSYAAQSTTGGSAACSVKKKETEKTQEMPEGGRPKSSAEYAKELAKLVPSAEFKVGNTFSSAKRGITLTVNPQLIEKMQNDPEKEKEMKELIKGVEVAVNMVESVNKGTGWTVVYKHCYIDENGKFWSVAYLRNDFMLDMSDKLREERRKNAEKLIEKTREKATEKKEELQEELEDRQAQKAEKDKVTNKAEQLIEDKLAHSKDGLVYLNDEEMKAILEAIKEDEKEQIVAKGQMAIGANLDVRI